LRLRRAADLGLGVLLAAAIVLAAATAGDREPLRSAARAAATLLAVLWLETLAGRGTRAGRRVESALRIELTERAALLAAIALGAALALVGDRFAGVPRLRLSLGAALGYLAGLAVAAAATPAREGKLAEGPARARPGAVALKKLGPLPAPLLVLLVAALEEVVAPHGLRGAGQVGAPLLGAASAWLAFAYSRWVSRIE
jgi:hypothetical protein